MFKGCEVAFSKVLINLFYLNHFMDRYILQFFFKAKLYLFYCFTDTTSCISVCGNYVLINILLKYFTWILQSTFSFKATLHKLIMYYYILRYIYCTMLRYINNKNIKMEALYNWARKNT